MAYGSIKAEETLISKYVTKIYQYKGENLFFFSSKLYSHFLLVLVMETSVLRFMYFLLYSVRKIQ